MVTITQVLINTMFIYKNNLLYEHGYSKTWSYGNNGVFPHIYSYMEALEHPDDPRIVTIG